MVLTIVVVALPLSCQQVFNNIAPLIYLGWIAGGIAFILYAKGIALVKGQIIQVVTMLEIVVASLSGILLLGERLNWQTATGGALILAGIVIVSGKK